MIDQRPINSVAISPVEVVEGCTPDAIPDFVFTCNKPLLLKGLVKKWPVVAAAAQSPEAVSQYICGFYNNELVNAAIGNSDNDGAIFYNEDLSGFTYQRQRTRLDNVLEQIRLLERAGSAQAYYVDSAPVEYCLPGFRTHNDLHLGGFKPRVSIWMGNKTRVSAHYDIPDNIACVVAGKRRFTVFPPEQLSNLYVGPLDFNPAGPAISMVDLNQPDYQKFPRFRDALEHAQVAELEPGDAIYIPGMWWHHVAGLEIFNVLINYWWSASPEYFGSPLDAFNHALMSIKSLPVDQRKSWQNLFEYYIFSSTPEQFSHIPPERKGMLGELDEAMVRRMRSMLLNRLNR
ncbi:cupin-like domain-containing protein [Cellvibrio mixtus]|uniref:cupin-like domain-containing protein n=1 Tax=Cellvibrio mixtus TaxID=39650 RepID=UPI000586A88F|nr:cupin-like domain-containing protein [Cellvibrio mixtus]